MGQPFEMGYNAVRPAPHVARLAEGLGAVQGCKRRCA